MNEVRIGGGWKEKLSEEFEKSYFKELSDFVRSEYKAAQYFHEALDMKNHEYQNSTEYEARQGLARIHR